MTTFKIAKLARFCSRCLCLAVWACLLLGHLQHYQLTGKISFYAHDVFIGLLLLINLPQLSGYLSQVAAWVNNKITCKGKLLALFFTIVIITAWLCQPLDRVLVAWLYLLRSLAYILFGWLFCREQFFTVKQKKQIITSFLLLFVLVSYAQYIFLPDLTFLGYLGWDDHLGRMVGTWFDPAFCGLVLIFVSIYFFSLKQFVSWRYLISGAALLAVGLTFSRANYLALLVAMIFFGGSNLLWLKKIWRPLYVLMFVLGVILGGSWLLPISQQHLTNSLWRTHSVIIRFQSAKAQWQDLSLKDYLLGRGLFVAAAEGVHGERLVSEQFIRPPANTPVIVHQTANFSDNLLILLISFFGIPLALIIIFYIGKFLFYCWRVARAAFFYTLCLLVNAQFNQAVFQPLVLLTFTTLLYLDLWEHNFGMDGKLNK